MTRRAPPRTGWRAEARYYAVLAGLTVAEVWWLPFGTVVGIGFWACDTATHGHPHQPALVHITIAVFAALIAHRARRTVHRWYERRDATTCPHPEHRIRHIHGDERGHGHVAQCMECRHLYRDWPGGEHDATRCWSG